MRKYRILTVTLLVFLSLAHFSCSDDVIITDEDGNMLEEFQIPTVIPKGNEQYLDLKSDYIFDQGALRTYELWLPESNLAFLDADPVAEEYVEGTLIMEGDTISPVGIRYKGSVGAFVDCLSGEDIFNPSGSKQCTKLSMKIKINWEGRDEKFYGLKKLQFHSQNLDPTQMHERLGYWLFGQMGVATSRSVHARVMINGRFNGIYALTEQIDNRFTKYNFEDGDGNLYKEIWPLDYRGNPRSESSFIAALKTNEDDNPSAEMIRSFATEMSMADDSQLKEIVNKWMDVNKALSYAIVDRAIRNDDGAFHWYCSDSGCGSHNFYWYEEPSEGKLYIVPWDLDNAFEHIIVDQNPVTPIADGWGEISNDCEPFEYGLLGLEQWSAACDKITRSWVLHKDEYDTLKEKFKNGPFSSDAVNSMLDQWETQIMEATREADNAFGDALSYDEWQRELSLLRTNLDFARNSL